MQNSKQILPSKDRYNFWHLAESKVSEISDKCFWGKWMVFVSLESLDELWKKVSALTIQGKLGPSSKTATARTNPNALDPNTKVIIVYTKDYRNLDDIVRVAWILFDQKIFTGPVLKYKSNDATRAGSYARKGQKTCMYSIDMESFQKHNSQAELTKSFKSNYSKTSEEELKHRKELTRKS